jgi:hypothetical protein
VCVFVGLATAAGAASAKSDPFGDDVRREMKRLASLFGKDNAKAALRPLVYGYIQLMRDANLKDAKPLTAAEKEYLKTFFPARLINKVGVVERDTTGIGNEFAGATTYGVDLIVVKKGHRNNSLFKHELVHVCQYDKHGVQGFAYRYANQYVDADFVYRKVKFEEKAYDFQRSGEGVIAGYGIAIPVGAIAVLQVGSSFSFKTTFPDSP